MQFNTKIQQVHQALGTVFLQAKLRCFHEESPDPLTLACAFTPSDVDYATLRNFFDSLYKSVTP
jgi:hypothetical protein